jgi:hypothetical protein
VVLKSQDSDVTTCVIVVPFNRTKDLRGAPYLVEYERTKEILIISEYVEFSPSAIFEKKQ